MVWSRGKKYSIPFFFNVVERLETGSTLNKTSEWAGSKKLCQKCYRNRKCVFNSPQKEHFKYCCFLIGSFLFNVYKTRFFLRGNNAIVYSSMPQRSQFPLNVLIFLMTALKQYHQHFYSLKREIWICAFFK